VGRDQDTMVRLDHGAIGNGRVLALVSPTSAIDWLCLPRFDSPSVFGRLLDAKKGGTFRFLSQGRELRGQLSYVRNTNVLSTRFEAADGAFEVLDFAPRIPDGLSVRVPYQLVRLVRPLSGQPRIRVDFDPRPDYARAPVALVPSENGLVVEWGGVPLHLHTNAPIPYLLAGQDFVLQSQTYFVLTYGRPSDPPSLARALWELDLTVAGWRAWAKTLALPRYGAEAVLRSALVLKLHAYHDTGAIIAAATTSIPEALGTPRTWDYRFCWLRDAAFTAEALRRVGHLAEGAQFLTFLRNVALSGPLQPLYAIDGARDAVEEMLPHLAGFADNGYVRVGNAAAEQRQNDLMGEIILCLETLLGDPRLVHDDREAYFPLIEQLVEEAITAAPNRDTSIWEFRTMLGHYTFSRAMCWAAVARGAKLARLLGQPAKAERWEAIAAQERAVVLERGYSERLGYFTQSLEGASPDASNLLLPTLGVIDARDPRFVSTLEAYERLLVEGGLMMRYRSLDDFGETTSAFTICSFWWAEALALVGRLDAAAEVFERTLRYANPVGLFSEDIDPKTGALLGNFPQAYTHVGLIHAAITIADLIEARDGTVRAWT